MQKVLHQKAIVQHGGKGEFSSSELEVGQTVDVVALHESSRQRPPYLGNPQRRS